MSMTILLDHSIDDNKIFLCDAVKGYFIQLTVRTPPIRTFKFALG